MEQTAGRVTGKEHEIEHTTLNFTQTCQMIKMNQSLLDEMCRL